MIHSAYPDFHLMASGFLWAVLVFQTPVWSPTMHSPVLPFIPKNTPSAHITLSFPRAPPTGFLLHRIASPNSKPSTLAFLPLHRSKAVLPSCPTSNRLRRYAAYSMIHGITAFVALIFTPHLVSSASFRTLTCPSTLWMARSTAPLLACEPTGDASITHRPPWAAFFLPTSSTRDMMAGSWSDFTTTSAASRPTSLRKAMTRLTTNSPVLLRGTAVAKVIRSCRDRATSMGTVPPGSPSSPIKA